MLFAVGKACDGREDESGVFFRGRIKRRCLGQIRDENETTFTAGAVDGCAADDGQEPGAEPARGPELGEFGVGFNERLLGYVLGGLVVAEDGPGSGMDMVFIAPDEVGVGIAVTGQDVANEIVVGTFKVRSRKIAYPYRRWPPRLCGRNVLESRRDLNRFLGPTSGLLFHRPNGIASSQLSIEGVTGEAVWSLNQTRQAALLEVDEIQPFVALWDRVAGVILQKTQ